MPNTGIAFPKTGVLFLLCSANLKYRSLQTKQSQSKSLSFKDLSLYLGRALVKDDFRKYRRKAKTISWSILNFK